MDGCVLYPVLHLLELKKIYIIVFIRKLVETRALDPIKRENFRIKHKLTCSQTIVSPPRILRILGIYINILDSGPISFES